RKDLELIAGYKFGYGTAVYQSAARYQIKDFTFHNPRLELKGKNFIVRSYAAIEDAGNSFNIGLTGAYLTRHSIRENYLPEWIGKYFDVLDTITNGFCADCIGDEIKAAVRANARGQAFSHAKNFWLKKGTAEFDSVYRRIVSDPNSQTGSRFFDKSALFHFEGQYAFDFIKEVDLLAGASYRLYMPNSNGTIFEDTMGRKIRVQEVGGFVQAAKRLAKDKLKIIGSVRLDKNTNFPVQFSPRLSFVIMPDKQNTIRISASRAFRIPTLQEQYLFLSIGNNLLVGNLRGYGTLYTQRSVDILDSLVVNKIYTIDQIENQLGGVLKTYEVKPLKTEQVITLDAGWRGEYLNKKLFIDLSSYFSYYQRFIGFTRVAAPVSGKADDKGLNDIYASVTDGGDTNFYTPLQLYVNLDKPVPAWGANVSISYYVGKGITPYINYTYADLYDKPFKEAENLQLTGFNTPRHKINVGVNASKVWKGLGFSANFKWVPDYEWQAPMGDGIIESYTTLDAAIFYVWEKAYSTFRIGGSNIYNTQFQTAIAAPFIGARYYAGWTFDLANFGIRNRRIIE
ncbi:MAG: TonB-dependent receptor, partial [Chitinophagales bacterium]|nr:TonB-dependent receptor [Chitinophagales bacterium]